MVNVFLYTDFRTFLKDELQSRRLRNHKYSLRAFARDTGISFSRMSEMLSSTDAISIRSAHKIATSFGMSDLEKEYFITLLVSRHGRTSEERKIAKKQIKQCRARRIFVRLREDGAGMLSQWYYPPLIELLSMRKVITIAEIAKILNIKEEAVTAAALHLAELGFLIRSPRGQWQKPHAFVKIDSPTPSLAIRRFHRKVLELGQTAIEKQPVEKRKYISCFLGVKKENIKSARLEIEKFNAEFLKKYASEKNAETVYCFSQQLFEME